MEPLVSVAPMVDVTNVFFRNFMRLLTRHSVLYTEMMIAHKVANGTQEERSRVLQMTEAEHKVVAQLGGSDPEVMAEAAYLCQQRGYDEININCGCPSNRVEKGFFGACLMLDPERVREIAHQMARRVSVPVTVKCRLGVDDQESYPNLCEFVSTVSQAGVTDFIIHARKAVLKGLSPAENRTIPPLRYNWVYDLVKEFPDLRFQINGGVQTHEMISEHLRAGVAGVMLGRHAYNNPWFFREVDSLHYKVPDQNLSRKEVILKYGEICDKICEDSGKEFNHVLMAKPLSNLFAGERSNKQWRRELDQYSKSKKLKSFSEVSEAMVRVMEEANPEALDRKSSV